MVIAKFMKDMQVKLERIPALGAIVYNAFVNRILSKPELEIAQNIVKEIDKRVILISENKIGVRVSTLEWKNIFLRRISSSNCWLTQCGHTSK